jgi:hypothetical protein
MVDCGCYWVGFVMRDRLFNRTCHTAAVKAWQDYQKGNVYLLQKKIKSGVWEYWWYRRTKHVESNPRTFGRLARP